MKASASAVEIAEAVKAGRSTALAEIGNAIGRIAAGNDRLGAFTDVLAPRALARAAAVDADIAAGKIGPLAGVPFAVKNLFDIEGIPTRAGSKINRDSRPAKADATLVRRLEAAGAVCVGALNMGEYASDFTGENAHDGPSRNPHDLDHMSGGSSGGTAAAVAGGLVPLALGSDTNGSLRVPASFCGLFTLKPTYGRLSRHGTFPFAASFDHLGPMARSVTDLALAYDVMQGYDDADRGMNRRPLEAISAKIERGGAGFRIAVADGYFTGDADVRQVVSLVAAAIDANRNVSLPEVEAARAAALLITMAEGGTLHLDRLRSRPQDFDPDVRDRLLAGAMLPEAWIDRAQRFRRRFREGVLKIFEHFDVVIAPATPMRAPKIGQKSALFGGISMPVRPNLGIFTQPFSFIGLPVVTVPVWVAEHKLPLGVQIVAAPWREDIVLRVARHLEMQAIVKAPVAEAFAET